MTEDNKPAVSPSPAAPEDDAGSGPGLLAAELALGIVPESEAGAARARLSDPAFAAEYRQWQERLAVIALRQTPVMAPARARQRIRERLGHAHAPLSVDPTQTPSRWPARLLWLVVLGGIAFAIWWVMNGQG